MEAIILLPVIVCVALLCKILCEVHCNVSCVSVIYCLLCIFGFSDTSSSIDKSVPLEMPNQRSAIAQAQGNITCTCTCINARV